MAGIVRRVTAYVEAVCTSFVEPPTEAEGFEPSVAFTTLAFKASAIVRSAMLPKTRVESQLPDGLASLFRSLVCRPTYLREPSTERQGFEPWRGLHPYRFSKPAH